MPLSCSGFTIKLPLEHVGYDDCLQCLNDITKCYAQTDGLMLHSERRAWFTAVSEILLEQDTVFSFQWLHKNYMLSQN